MRSGTTVWSTGVSSSTPSISMVEDPAPRIMAPIRFKKAARSAISGSLAALSITVVPLARTAASNRFSVAPDTRELEHDVSPEEPLRPPLDVAVLEGERGAHLLEAGQVHVNRAGPEVVAAGKGHPCLPEPPEQGAEDVDGRPHALHQLVGRLEAALRSPPDDELVGLRPHDLESHVHQQLTHGVDVGDARDVGEAVLAFGEQGGGHQLERRILRPSDLHHAFQGGSRPHDDLVHGRPVWSLRAPPSAIGAGTGAVRRPATPDRGCSLSDLERVARR